MRLFGGTPGDQSVGIPSCDFEVKVGFEVTSEDRDDIKIQITKFMEELHDNGPADSWWEDECPDCKIRMKNNVCINSRCITYLDFNFDTRELEYCLECRGKTIGDLKKWMSG